MNVPSLPTDPISAGLDVAAEVISLGIQVDGEMNTPEMIQAAKDQEKQKLKDQFNEALEKGDTETIRKLIAGL